LFGVLYCRDSVVGDTRSKKVEAVRAAEAKLGVTHHRIRCLIKDGIPAAGLVVPGSPGPNT